MSISSSNSSSDGVNMALLRYAPCPPPVNYYYSEFAEFAGEQNLTIVEIDIIAGNCNISSDPTTIPTIPTIVTDADTTLNELPTTPTTGKSLATDNELTTSGGITAMFNTRGISQGSTPTTTTDDKLPIIVYEAKVVETDSLSAGATVGIVFGVLLFVVIAVVLVIWLWRKKRNTCSFAPESKTNSSDKLPIDSEIGKFQGHDNPVDVNESNTKPVSKYQGISGKEQISLTERSENNKDVNADLNPSQTLSNPIYYQMSNETVDTTTDVPGTKQNDSDRDTVTQISETDGADDKSKETTFTTSVAATSTDVANTTLAASDSKTTTHTHTAYDSIEDPPLPETKHSNTGTDEGVEKTYENVKADPPKQNGSDRNNVTQDNVTVRADDKLYINSAELSGDTSADATNISPGAFGGDTSTDATNISPGALGGDTSTDATNMSPGESGGENIDDQISPDTNHCETGEDAGVVNSEMATIQTKNTNADPPNGAESINNDKEDDITSGEENKILSPNAIINPNDIDMHPSNAPSSDPSTDAISNLSDSQNSTEQLSEKTRDSKIGSGDGLSNGTDTRDSHIASVDGASDVTETTPKAEATKTEYINVAPSAVPVETAKL